jgi:hypothetical protein
MKAPVRVKTLVPSIHEVRIAFLSADSEAFELRAAVRIEESGMVIDIPEQTNETGIYSPAYFVRGELEAKCYYAGKNTSPHPGTAKAICRWARLGDVYVGLWREDGSEFLIRFQL